MTVIIIIMNCYCCIGTFPYEVSQSPLPSGSHMFTAFQSEPGGPGVIQTGATQFLLPRKQWIKRITIIAKGHFPISTINRCPLLEGPLL